MRILIADDDVTSRMLMKHLLYSFGKCDLVMNGKEAIQAYNTAQEEGQPYDLICLDIFMPYFDGNAVLMKIRSIEKSNAIPREKQVKVIMITGLASRKNVIRSIKGQCNGFLAKPVDGNKLFGILRSLNLIGDNKEKVEKDGEETQAT